MVEGVFKSSHIDSEPYFNWVFSYIHLNPVKMIDKDWKEKGISNPEKAEKFMNDYKYSSFYDYFIDDRIESVILNKEESPEYFSKMNDFSELIQEFRSSGF